MKPFDLEAALRGEPVITRDGRPVTQLTNFHAPRSTFTLVGVLDGERWTWRPNGTASCGDSTDLFMVPKKRTVWVNLYPSGSGYHYPAEEKADDHATPYRIGNKAYPIEIEE